MKILIRSINTSGEPLPTGRVVRGCDSLEIVEIMHCQTPFTASKPLPRFMTDLLTAAEGQSAKPLPEDPGKAASEFLTRLAALGLIEFLNDKADLDYPKRFFQVMEAIRRSGLTNMLDWKVVGQIAQELGFGEISEWLRTHRREYAEYVLGGRIRFLDDSDGKAGEDVPCADK